MIQSLSVPHARIGANHSLAWFGVAASKVGPYSDTADGKVVIFCGSDHLASIDANTGMFRDQLNSYSPVKLRPGMTVACSGDYEAFGYQLAGGGFAIVLCGQSPHSALQASTEGLKMYRAWQFEGKPVDGAKILMTYKILYEFIHVADPINQCALLLWRDLIPCRPWFADARI